MIDSVDHRGKNFGGEDLSRRTFRRGEFFGADLRGVNLSHTTLRGADLRRANLDGANLTEADTTGADFRHASLKGVAGLVRQRDVAAELLAQEAQNLNSQFYAEILAIAFLLKRNPEQSVHSVMGSLASESDPTFNRMPRTIIALAIQTLVRRGFLLP